MKNKLLEIDLNEADEYDFDDFTQNLEYELFEHKDGSIYRLIE